MGRLAQERVPHKVFELIQRPVITVNNVEKSESFQQKKFLRLKNTEKFNVQSYFEFVLGVG